MKLLLIAGRARPMFVCLLVVLVWPLFESRIALAWYRSTSSAVASVALPHSIGTLARTACPVVLLLRDIRHGQRGHNTDANADNGARAVAIALTGVLHTGAYPAVQHTTGQHADCSADSKGDRGDAHGAQCITDRRKRKDGGKAQQHDHLHGAVAYDSLNRRQ